MKLEMSSQCDVFVIGAGLAGIRAAVEISGCRVILASSVNIFSGSSFYPGTWGLGLVGPENQEDVTDFKQTIQKVGCHMCDEKLVDIFVKNIHSGIEELKSMGVELKQANDTSQKEFIPCFDYKKRDWNGLLFQSLKDVLSKKIIEKKITVLEHHEVVDIVFNQNHQICGVIVLYQNQFKYIGCKSIVIATGGFGGLYKYRLNTNDICGMGQYLALKSGAKLINMEYIQMMPGFISPCYKTIYNEKMFKYSHFKMHNQDLFYNKMDQDLLQIRSTYGPFTSRLPSKTIDIEIFKQFIHDEKGVTVHYDTFLKNTKIEFIQTYFQWLKEQKRLDIDTPIQLGIFYHAANGGIQIDETASTCVPGLFACGEATGGMHGADRIGGLSSANGLVFGKIAGHNAACYAMSNTIDTPHIIDIKPYCIENAKEYLKIIQDNMFHSMMILRNEKGLQEAYQNIVDIEDQLIQGQDHDYQTSYHLKAALTLSKAMIKVALLRKESRGSHYREDYPNQDSCFDNIFAIENSEELIITKEQRDVSNR